MLTIDNRTLNHLAERLAPRIAERLAARPRAGDVAGDPEEMLTEIQAAALLGLRPATLCTWRSRGTAPLPAHRAQAPAGSSLLAPRDPRLPRRPRHRSGELIMTNIVVPGADPLWLSYALWAAMQRFGWRNR